MPMNNMFSTWFNGWFWTGAGFWTSGWNNQEVKEPTKQQKFPWLNDQQIANIEKYTANLTWIEKDKEQQKIYQAMIQAIEERKYNDSRTAAENERFKNSLSKSDPKECKFDQSACRQSTLVDMVKSARNLKANTPEDTVMSMFMEEMNYRGISMDKLNSYLDSWDETILYEAWLKTNQGGTKDIVNQLSTTDKTWEEKNLWEKIDTATNYSNLIGLWAEKVDEAASKFADKFTITGEKSVNNLKEKIENMSKEEVEQYRKQYEQLLKDKDRKVATVTGDNLVEKLWNGLVKKDLNYDYKDEDFMKWLISQKANLWQSLIWADDVLQWEHNPNVIKFFGNIPSSAVKTFTATVRWMTNPYDTLKWLYKIAATEEWHQAILSRYWSRDAFADAMNTDPVGVADDMLAVAELGGNIISGWLKFTWKLTWSQNLTNAGNRVKANNFWSANDVLAQKTVGGIYGWMNKISDLSNSSVVKTANNILQTESSLSKMNDVRKDVQSAVANSKLGQGVKNFWDEAINKVVWIDEADRKFIQENKDLVNDFVDWKKNVETVFDEVKEKLSDKALEKAEMWAEYDNLAKNKKKIVNTQWMTNDKDLMKTFKKNWISVDADWNLAFEKINEFDAKQQKALQDAWEVLKDMEWEWKLNTQQTLSQRRKIDNKVNWEWKPDKLSTADKDVEWLIREMRKTIDNVAKRDIPWLADLDAKYQPLIEEVRQMNKDWYDSNWKIKDSARSKLRNITRAWNEEKLSRLEKIAPWITQDLKALDVALTVEKATKQWVWQYAKWFWAGGIAWAIVTWQWGAALAGIGLWILATPKNFIRIMEAYPDIAEKLSAWQELLPSDVNRLQALASRIQDWVEE